MSYLSRLSQLKSGLDSQNQQFQSEQDNFTRDAENMRQVAQAKVEDYARNLEQAGGIGFGAIKAGQSVKSLYKKWRGKKDKPKDEDTEEPTEETPDETTEAPQQQLPVDEGEGEIQQPTGNEETSNERGPEETQEDEGPEMTGDGDTVADTSHLPSEMEMNDASNLGQTQGTTTLENEGDVIQARPTPPAQQAVLDADPESTMNVNDASSGLAGDAGADVGELTGDAITDATTSGTSALLDGLAVAGDVVLDAIPVVGELAMIGTAIAGFFEGLFGEKDTPPPPPAPAIISKVGQDASAIVQKAPSAVAGVV